MVIIPDEFPSFLHGYETSRERIGRSGNSVFLLDAPERQPLVVKIFEPSKSVAAKREHARLSWLGHAGIPVPQPLSIRHTKDACWLIMERLPGCNAVGSQDKPETKIGVMANALSRLHALGVATCPYNEMLSVKIARAQDNIRNGLVDERDFDDDHRHMNAPQLLAQLIKTVPTSEDIVVVHGDASLPNFILRGGQLSGIVDCGNVGLSDRYQDLAICSRSIRYNLGEEWVDPFLDAYGVKHPDYQRMRFYRMLDEFF
ncbi:MAG: aminoglycoside 3'-phosphotransferase [Hyphomicrobiales bacterium]|nr:aminoglycoside 3'-phosphotransferase [Hyphomicrobiales bacterium]